MRQRRSAVLQQHKHCETPSVAGPSPAGADRQPKSIIELLQGFPTVRALFAGLDPAVICEIEESLQWFGLSAGNVLFEEGEPAPDAFVLTSGQLGVLVGPPSRRKTVAKIGAGQLVGEMALVSEAPRSATVVALRDCDLVRLPRSTVELLLQSSPEANRFMLRLLAARLSNTSRGSSGADATDSIAFVPLGEAEPLAEPLAWLTAQVSPIRLGAADEEDRWRHAAAPGVRPVAYIAQDCDSAWARHCIRNADRVIFVASADAGVCGRDALAYAARLGREMDLVLVNKPAATAATGAAAWLYCFPGERIQHVRLGNAGDYGRVKRLILRCGICVVFSGGGARGFAHLGVLKAFAEHGVPIDAVGGTSIGGIVAGGVALGLSPEGVAAGLQRAFVDTNPVRDFTLPLISLARGRKSKRLLRETYGEVAIENLWKTFFCVSANLTTRAPMVHQSGLLWQALAATSAIPGIFPPVIANQQVLVDGGMMDNFPTGIMRSFRCGSVVGVEVSSGRGLTARDVAVDEKSMAWLLLRGLKHSPSILRILVSAGTASGGAQTAASRAAADVLIQPALDGVDMLSFKAFDKAVEAGYRAALEAIPTLDPLRRGELMRASATA
jgi:NTE family protein